jgi:hypothetical protein
MLYLYVEAVIFKIWKYTPHMGSSESKAKGSFGQKEFYFSIMGETALEEEPRARGTLNIVIFLIKKKSSTNFII